MLHKGVIRIYLKMILVRYILAICIAAVAVTLIIVVLMKKRKTESKVYRAVRSFEFVVLAVVVFLLFHILQRNDLCRVSLWDYMEGHRLRVI